MGKLKAILIVMMMCMAGFTLLVPVGGADPGPMMEPMSTEARTVVAELFTGATCGPCTNADLGLSDFLEDHDRDEVVALVYHRPIPSADKLATAETATRHQWYSSAGTSTPNMWVDGTLLRVGGFTTRLQGEQWWESQYNTRKTDASQINITTDGFISPSLTGTVWINVTALETPDEDNLYLHVVIVRREYHWNAPNGVPVHHYLVRKMLPGANGEAISPTVGTPISKQYSFDLSGDGSGTDMWTVEDDMAVVAFVQTHDRTAGGNDRYIAPILQAQYSNLRTVPNKVPTLASGHAEYPDGATEDDDVSFKVWYQDIDDYADKGPSEAKVYIKNGTDTPTSHDLIPVPSGEPYTMGKWLRYTTKLLPGTYTYRFSANDGDDDAIGDIAWNATQITILPRNKAPQLSTHSCAPEYGDTNTVFRFDVLYRDLDNEEPTDAKIYIDDIAYDMVTDSTGPWNSWVTFYYETTLSVKDMYRFYFVFSDGKDSMRMPLASSSPNFFIGPEVVAPNNEPTLTGGMFTPAEGTRDTEFTFTIVYTDGENDHPTMSYVYIDDVAYIMNPDGSSYESGVTFRYTTRLSMGNHNIHYAFNDGTNPVRFPLTGYITGPVISNLPPVAVIAMPSDGVRFTPEDYISFSAVGTEDPEGDEMSYMWTSDISGDLSALEAFDKVLPEGEHTITLEVTDSYGGVHSTSVSITVKAKVAHTFVVRIMADPEEPVEMDRVKYTVTLDNDGEIQDTGVEVRFLVDNVQVSSDTMSVPRDTEIDKIFTWPAAVVGTHTITIEVGSESKDFNEVVTANTLPEVTASFEETDGTELKVEPGKEVYFDISVSDVNGDTFTYLWDFGDGITSTNERPSHVYSEAGDYTVKVTVTDERGGSVYKELSVTVTKPDSDDESPGFGALLAFTAFLAASMAVAVRRRR